MKKICNVSYLHRRNDTRIFQKECDVETRDYEVHFIVADNKPDEIKNNVYIHGINTIKIRVLRVLFGLFTIYKKAKSVNADIYVLHDLDLLLIAFFLKKMGKCVIWDCHEDYSENFNDIEGPLRPFRFFIRWAFQKIYIFNKKYIDGCLAANTAITSWLHGLGYRNIFLLHNYALLKTFHTYVISDNLHKNHVLFAGGIRNLWLFNLFVQALPLCKNDIRMLVCGTFAYNPDKIVCMQLPGWQKVDFKGFVSAGDIKQFSQQCFAAIATFNPLSNFNISFSPNKIYEYMAMRLPLIVDGRYTTLKNIVASKIGPTGLGVDTPSAQAIANAFDYLYENKDIAKQMGENGRKMFETEYHFERYIDDLLTFIKKCSHP